MSRTLVIQVDAGAASRDQADAASRDQAEIKPSREWFELRAADSYSVRTGTRSVCKMRKAWLQASGRFDAHHLPLALLLTVLSHSSALNRSSCLMD